MEKAFRIFYSWQSDLPGDNTRYFIRKCIDNAISLARKSEMIEATRDEATSGKTGSPDIVSSIYEKIDQCDLFIADLSLCYSSETKDGKNKKSPNPNVLIELGYAVHSIGWERIICFCNTDYGSISDLPFDIQHNRISGFSFAPPKQRRETFLEQSNIIVWNICALREGVPRSMLRRAFHVIGTYNSNSESVVNSIEPIHLDGRIDEEKTNSLEKSALSLYNQLSKLTAQICENERIAVEKRKLAEETNKALQDVLPGLANLGSTILSLSDSIKAPQHSYYTPVTAKSKDLVTTWLNQLLKVTPCDEFFSFGSLVENRLSRQLGCNPYEGTILEKEKHKMYIELVQMLFCLWIRKEYPKTFDGMLFFPIAIQNISDIQDEDINVVITVRNGDTVAPSKELINPILSKYAGQISESGIVEELFSLPEHRYIEAEPVPFNASSLSIPNINYNMYGKMEKSAANANDYERKLEEYIMPPQGQSYYNFHVASLRPAECRWLCCGILVIPSESGVTLEYKIYSEQSNGELTGILCYPKK